MGIAVITGATSGIGRAFVEQLGRSGGREVGGLEEIWAVGRRIDRLEELAHTSAVPVRPCVVDLAKPDAPDALRAMLEAAGVDVRLVVNSAGFGKFGTYAAIDVHDALRMIDVDCRAAVGVAEACVPFMARGSRIINVCSSAAFQPLPGMNVYAAAKAFLLRYSRGLRWELAPRGIRVCAVCPGWVRTEFMEVARADADARAVRHFPFAMRPQTVARRALRASRVLAVATCGAPWLVQRIASKFLPHCFIMACWEGIRRV